MPGLISEKDATYIFDIVRNICAQVSPGLPGSSQEPERTEILKRETAAPVERPPQQRKGKQLAAPDSILKQFDN